MSTSGDDQGSETLGSKKLRGSVYAMLIAIAAGSMLGRILAVDSVDRQGLEEVRLARVPAELAQRRQALEARGVSGRQLDDELRRIEAALRRDARLERPFLSANDRSRWCTVRALMEPSLRVEGAPYAIDKVIAQPNWDTIDMVKHDGHLYSSKPPLFPTLLAGGYWLVYQATGWTLASEPYAVGRVLLIAVNVLPLVLYFCLLARLVERFGTTDWGRIFVVAAAAFGTFLTTFAVVINNHSPAAVCAMVAVYAAVRIWFDGRRSLWYFALAGLAAAFCAANELPAASLFAALSLVLLCKAPKQTLLAYAPAALVVAAGFFGTNWVAHHSLRPPYMHRSETDPSDNWYAYDYESHGRMIPSYWKNRVGIDRGEASPAVYALHVLVGHHGIFSLTPVWLLSVAGLGIWLFGGFRVQGSGFRISPSSPPHPQAGTGPGGTSAQDSETRNQAPPARPLRSHLRQLALLIGLVSVVCLAFYLARPQDDRNYGGMTCGFRWMFWFAPMWLLAMVPAADAMAARRWTRAVALVLLAVSVLSVSYPTWNPWTHPWLVNYLQWLGWIRV